MTDQPVTSEQQAPLPPPPPAEGGSPTIVRGTRSGPRLVPRPAPPKDATIITRHMLRSASEQKPQTDRERKIAGDLPDWEPLPPGELTVKRS